MSRKPDQFCDTQFEVATLQISGGFQCMECGLLLDFEEAQLAADVEGCPNCGGSDVDLYVPGMGPEPKTWEDI